MSFSLLQMEKRALLDSQGGVPVSPDNVDDFCMSVCMQESAPHQLPTFLQKEMLPLPMVSRECFW